MKEQKQQATLHEIIGCKTDCKYFSGVGNLCSRIENGMMRCDEYLECEFKYIDELKKENKALRKRFEELVSDLGWHCIQCTKEAENCRLKTENEKSKTLIKEIKETCSNQDLYRGRQALATRILKIISEVTNGRN